MARFAFGGHSCFGNRLFVGDAGLLDRLARGNLRLLGLGLAQRTFARDFRALKRAAHLDVALLVEAGGLALALDFQRLALGFEVASADLDHRILFDVVAQLALGLDVFHQAGQALGVEPVRRIEIFQVGLVEIGDGDELQFEPVLANASAAAALSRVTYSPRCSCICSMVISAATERMAETELAGEKGMQLLGLQRAPAECRGGDGDGFPRRLHADVKIGFDVDPHAVAGNDRVMLGAHDPHRQHVHVDRSVVVNERQHEGAAVDHDPLAEQTGSHKGHFLGRTVIEPVHDVDDDGDHDDRCDQPEDQFANQGSPTSLPPFAPGVTARRSP